MVILIETNIQDNGLLTCSECGAKNYKSLLTHIKRVHKMTMDEYKEKHPDDQLYTDELQKKFSKGGFNANKAMVDKGLDFSERSKKARKTELKNDPDAYLKRNRKLYQDPGFRQRSADRVMKVSKYHGKRYYYNDIPFRSTWEVTFAKWLDSENIKYKYEGVKVIYKDPETDQNKLYYPDFYIPDYNLCIEIKPKCYLGSDRVQAKAKACKDKGYNFKFITQDELSNLSTKLLNV